MSNKYKDELLKTLRRMNETIQDIKKDIDAMINDIVESETPSLFPEEEAKAEVSDEKKITLEELRAHLADLARDGKSEDIRKLLKDHKCERLSEVPEAEYETLMKEAKELADA